MIKLENQPNIPFAIIAGSIIISFSILVSGGIIKVKGLKEATPSSTPAAVNQPQAAAQQANTEADIIKNLKTYAAKLNLDQGKFNKCLDSGEKAEAVSSDAKEGADIGVVGTPSFFINGRPFLKGAAPFGEFKTIIDEELNNSSPSAERKNVGVGNFPALGNPLAPVTIVEFSDYQCPYCARFYKDAEVSIKKEYIDNGKVKLFYRDFPLIQIHQGAQKAAEAARCAADQNKYWEFHDLIFQNQQNIF